MRVKSANCACKWCSYMDKHGETAWPWLAYQSGIRLVVTLLAALIQKIFIIKCQYGTLLHAARK